MYELQRRDSAVIVESKHNNKSPQFARVVREPDRIFKMRGSCRGWTYYEPKHREVNININTNIENILYEKPRLNGGW
jgi:hypothetical protein